MQIQRMCPHNQGSGSLIATSPSGLRRGVLRGNSIQLVLPQARVLLYGKDLETIPAMLFGAIEGGIRVPQEGIRIELIRGSRA